VATVTFTLEDLTKLIAKRHFCILATQGLHGPHAVGVGYFASGLDLYIPASAKTVKVRNIRRDQRIVGPGPSPSLHGGAKGDDGTVLSS
jgi:nitroimidazol reductase NimA-like FMN-containing flavoprotein (pyridoxamine 5'-phosphate oxidase superfamily)